VFKIKEKKTVFAFMVSEIFIWHDFEDPEKPSITQNCKLFEKAGKN
jgi:hypothetical protein